MLLKGHYFISHQIFRSKTIINVLCERVSILWWKTSDSLSQSLWTSDGKVFFFFKSCLSHCVVFMGNRLYSHYPSLSSKEDE